MGRASPGRGALGAPFTAMAPPLQSGPSRGTRCGWGAARTAYGSSVFSSGEREDTPMCWGNVSSQINTTSSLCPRPRLRGGVRASTAHNDEPPALWTRGMTGKGSPTMSGAQSTQIAQGSGPRGGGQRCFPGEFTLVREREVMADVATGLGQNQEWRRLLSSDPGGTPPGRAGPGIPRGHGELGTHAGSAASVGTFRDRCSARSVRA